MALRMTFTDAHKDTHQDGCVLTEEIRLNYVNMELVAEVRLYKSDAEAIDKPTPPRDCDRVEMRAAQATPALKQAAKALKAELDRMLNAGEIQGMRGYNYTTSAIVADPT